MSPNAKSHIFGNLAKYVRSGMGIEKACESLLSQPGVPAGERKIYESIENGVRSGQSIADAMSASSKIDRLDFEMLDASERGGRLDEGLNHLADYYRRVARTRKRIRKGLTYPIFLFHFALIVTTFASAMFSRLNPAGPDQQSFLSAVLANGKWIFLIYIVIVGLILFLLLMKKRARHFSAPDLVLNRIPILGPARRFAALDRFSSVFQIFLLAGLKMDESLKGASRASDSGLIRAASREGIAWIQGGEKLARVFLEHPRAFPNDFARGIASAEEAGMLDLEFGRWKQFYSDSLSDAMDQVAEWVPKLVYFTTLFIVAWMIIRAGLAYQGLIQGLLEGI